MAYPSLFSIPSPEAFEALTLEVFRYQFEQVSVYRKFCDLLNVSLSDVTSIQDIPFLPIQFFKEHIILSSERSTEKIFSSSGTTGNSTSKHHIGNLSLYEDSFLNGFEQYYGNPKEWVILALLPSYLERGGSSLVYMADHLIARSKHPDSGFYLDDYDALSKNLKKLEARGQKTILLGVSYALLDLIEKESFQLRHTIVMETGGMKGRRKEMVKEELHNHLQLGFDIPHIHSEYGMTELLSQAYSQGDGLFSCPPWMKVLTRDPEDPFSWVAEKTGGLNIIDLANYYSCSFLATQDLGKVYPDGTFKILGRFDNSDLRGCNLMISL